MTRFGFRLMLLMLRLHLIHVARIEVVSTGIPCRRLHPVLATTMSSRLHCIHLYPRVEHCLKLVSVYMYPSTCTPVAHPGYMYQAKMRLKGTIQRQGQRLAWTLLVQAMPRWLPRRDYSLAMLPGVSVEDTVLSRKILLRK